MAMYLDGDFAKADFGCDLLIEEPGSYERHDLTLPVAERLVTVPQLLESFLGRQLRAVKIKSGVDGIEDVLLAQWLGQEFDRSGLHRSHGHGNITVTGNHNRWNDPSRICQLPLKVQTAHLRQPHIQNQT